MSTTYQEAASAAPANSTARVATASIVGTAKYPLLADTDE